MSNTFPLEELRSLLEKARATDADLKQFGAEKHKYQWSPPACLKEVEKFERETLKGLGLIPEITVRYRSTYFSHIFNGGYSAGYYAYTWAEVLDADAFEAFKETGDIFNPEKAKAFHRLL